MTSPAWCKSENLGGSGSFALPDAGWERVDGPSSIALKQIFQFTDSEGEENTGLAVIELLRPVAGDPTTFPANFSQLLKRMPDLTGKEPTWESAGTTLTGYPIRVQKRCCQKLKSKKSDFSMEADVVHVGIQGAGIQLFLTLLTMQMPDEQKKRAVADFEAIVRSVRLAAGDAPFELIPAKDGGGMEGAFLHHESGLSLNGFGGVDYSSRNEILFLDRAGLFSKSLPTDGGAIKDHCRATPEDCGTYRLLKGGGQIEMLTVMNGYGVAETNVKPFKGGSDGLTLDDKSYMRIPPFKGDTRLDGVWHYTFGSSGSMSFSSGSIAGERVLTLTKQGTFGRNGWAGVSASQQTGNFHTDVSGSSTSANQTGRYQIEDYRLVLTSDDGQTSTLTIFRPDADSDELLIINGAYYLKETPKNKR